VHNIKQIIPPTLVPKK